MTVSVHARPWRGRRVGAAGECAAWLAVLALVIQSWLPLIDAAVHRHWPADAAGISTHQAGAPVVALAKQSPAHAHHDCPICQFIASLGSFSPPASSHGPAPARLNGFAIWPAAPPVVRAAAAAAAQPRAPPHSI